MKAIIMSHERGGSYVMDKEGFFEFVKGYAAQPIGTEIEIASHPLIAPSRVVPAITCLILVAALSIFAYLWNTVNYSVYMDINPSIELQFNALDKLKNATPLDEDGAELLEGLKLSGSAADIVLTLINSAEQKGYLEAGNDGISVAIKVVARGGRAYDAYVSTITAMLDIHQKSSFTTVEGSSMD